MASHGREKRDGVCDIPLPPSLSVKPTVKCPLSSMIWDSRNTACSNSIGDIHVQHGKQI